MKRAAFPETKIASENDGWKTTFILGRLVGRCHVLIFGGILIICLGLLMVAPRIFESPHHNHWIPQFLQNPMGWWRFFLEENQKVDQFFFGWLTKLFWQNFPKQVTVFSFLVGLEWVPSRR